jgi:hypothetical protein
MPMESLQNAKYREIMSLRLFYDWHTYAIALFQPIRSNRVLQRSADDGSCDHDATSTKSRTYDQETRKVGLFTKVCVWILLMKRELYDDISAGVWVLSKIESARRSTISRLTTLPNLY